jgi:hypothetical protein
MRDSTATTIDGPAIYAAAKKQAAIAAVLAGHDLRDPAIRRALHRAATDALYGIRSVPAPALSRRPGDAPAPVPSVTRHASTAAPATGGIKVAARIQVAAACVHADAATRSALRTGEREDGSPITGRAAAALIRDAGCAACPVRDDCGRYGHAAESHLPIGERVGFYGGHGPRARERVYGAA